MAIVAFDAGHGIDTYPPAKGVPEMAEFEFNAAVVDYAMILAARNDLQILLTQDLNGVDTPLPARTRIALNAGADLLVSFHADWSPNPSARGHWVFYWYDHPPSRRLAEIWDRHARELLPIPRRGPTPSRPGTWTNFHMTREPARRGMPSILVEHGFMSNPDDLEHLLSEEYRRLCAVVAVKACCEFLDKPYRGDEEMTQKPQWKTESIDYFFERNMLKDPEGWKDRIDEPLPVWAGFIMLRRIHQDMVERTEPREG